MSINLNLCSQFGMLHYIVFFSIVEELNINNNNNNSNNNNNIHHIKYNYECF